MTPSTPKPSTKRAIGGGMIAVVLALASVLVHKWEPSPRNPLIGYADPLAHGIPTACDGVTGHGIVVGQSYTQAQCDTWKREELYVALQAVNRCIYTPLTPNQAAALVDGVYNAGPALVCGSTLQRLANSGAPASRWCLELNKWVYADHRRIQGLANRRADDVKLCLKESP